MSPSPYNSTAAVVFLDETVLSVEEGDSEEESVALCVVLENAFDGLEREIAVNLTTTPGTAGAH